MFTGIISEIGTIQNIETREGLTVFTVQAPKTCADLAIGDSVAVNGACHTAVSIADGSFTTESMPETLRCTNLGDLEEGSQVNLERPAVVGGRLDGHIVTGHIDLVTKLLARQPDGEAELFNFEVSDEAEQLIVEKGSVALDGISLTVAAMKGNELTVALIPHTLSSTTLGQRQAGDAVNLELDILAKHVQKLTQSSHD